MKHVGVRGAIFISCPQGKLYMSREREILVERERERGWAGKRGVTVEGYNRKKTIQEKRREGRYESQREREREREAA